MPLFFYRLGTAHIFSYFFLSSRQGLAQFLLIYKCIIKPFFSMTIKELYEQAVEGGFEDKEVYIDCEHYAGIERAPYEPSVIDDCVYI